MRYYIFYILTRLLHMIQRGLSEDILDDIEIYAQCKSSGKDCIFDGVQIESVGEIIKCQTI